MKKIAICLPSYNEHKNIKKITKNIDKALNLINTNYKCFIVNCDNNSPDKTNYIFKTTNTTNQKISILTSKKGKGENIYNFLKFCHQEDIDYAITIDTDTKSFHASWLIRILKVLTTGVDFTYPLYIREKEEGNTTNHFVTLMLYKIYGKFIRQPLGGDYGFTKDYINKILTITPTDNILKYGIDIFLVISAISNNFNMQEVFLGYKKHNPSYHKMLSIFDNVVKGFIDTYNLYPTHLPKKPINYTPFVLSNKVWPYRSYFDSLYQEYLTKHAFKTTDYFLIEEKWLEKLTYFANNINALDEEFLINLKEHFLIRSVSFWDRVNLENNKKWEEIIIKNCLKLGEENEN